MPRSHLNRADGGDDLDAFRVRGGDGFVALGYALEEGAVGFLHAIADERHGGLARAQALFADGLRDFQEQGQVGAGVPDGEVNHMFDRLQIELSSVALVRGGGIVKTVADDDFAAGEGGADDFADELGATGVHEQQLGFAGHRGVGMAVLERVADFLTDGRPAGFAEHLHRVTPLAQSFHEQRDLRAFAAAFVALECDE